MSDKIVKTQQKYLPTTSKAFLEIYNPKQLQRRLIAIKTIEQAIQMVAPSIGEIKRSYGTKVVEAYLKYWLIDLNAVLNLKRPLNELQIDECAMLICSDFNSITIADINLVFKRAKSGHYGALLASLSINIIVGWFTKYFDEKCNAGAQMSQREADAYKYYAEKSERTSVVHLKKIMAQDDRYNREKFEKQYLKKPKQ